ncbi:MAG: endo-1,4-beta-xylanase, partial [Lachnospiraceae bacterium]|nr:endo-1,4-beta-xylanase [Lachnospiraceae bacterium]
LVIPAISAPESQAAAKPKMAKKVSITVGSTKKIAVKKVKAKKIKKTTWKIAEKKIAKITKKKKNFVKVKGLKKGNATLTAKVKVGKKTYKLKTKINVTGASATPTPSNGGGNKNTPSPTPANGGGSNTGTSTPSPTPTNGGGSDTGTPTPTLRPLTSVSTVEVPKRDAYEFPTTPPNPTVDPATALAYSADFEDVEVGTRTQDKSEGEGIKGFVLRGGEGQAGISNDYLEVVDGATIQGPDGGPLEEPNTHGHVLRCFRQEKTWQGPMLNLTDALDAGCTYVLKAELYSPKTDLMGSYQLQTTEDTEPGYGNFGPTSGSITKIPQGKWTSVEFTISIPDDKYYYALYFESYNGNGNSDIYLDNVTVTKTIQNSRDTSIASIKDTYEDVFDIVGVGAGTASLFGQSASEFIVDQYNAYTPGNEMKPDAIMGSSMSSLTIEEAKELGYIIPDDYTKYDDNRQRTSDNSGEFIVPKLNFTTVDQILKECHDKGLKLRGHTLVWHEQTPVYFFQQNYRTASGVKYNTTQEVMDVRLEFFVKSVLEHVLSSEYADCLYGYDVVNEYLHSARADSAGKPTYWGSIYGTADSTVKSGVTLRPSYVKKAFEYADEMLKKHNREDDVKLFYNDYNCYQYPDDVVHLTDFINEDSKVCDGIGMQSHLDISQPFHSANNYATALEFFHVNAEDLEIHITELDATMRSTEENPLFDEDQAAYYDQIMNAILTNKKNGGNITGLVIWSLYDGVSWRNQQYPCIFRGLYAPKSAFYAVIDAKARYWTE